MDSKALRATFPSLALLALLVTAGCATSRRVEVHSTPAGARILVDGQDSGQKTPASIELMTSKNRYLVRLEKAGYNPVEREVERAKDVDVMGPDEAVGRICCSPCCCFLPLLGFLKPFDIETKFVPDRIDATLEVAGQGARLEVTPSQYEAYLDGKLVAILEGSYIVTTPGDHELEVRAQGYHSYMRSIHVDERIYQRLKIELQLEGQGLMVIGTPAGSKCYLDDQYQGNLGDEPRRIRAEPGPHMLRIEAEGYRPWQDVVQVVADRFEEISIDLKLEGQGIIVRKPEGISSNTQEIQILVGGQLQGSAFDQPIRLEPGDQDVEIRVSGYETRKVQVRVTKDSYLELTPGPKIDTRRGNPQVRLRAMGVRVHAPDDLDDLEDSQVEVFIDGALAGYGFDHFIPSAGPGQVQVSVQVPGYKAWSEVVQIRSGETTDLHPRFERE